MNVCTKGRSPLSLHHFPRSKSVTGWRGQKSVVSWSFPNFITTTCYGLLGLATRQTVLARQDIVCRASKQLPYPLGKLRGNVCRLMDFGHIQSFIIKAIEKERCALLSCHWECIYSTWSVQWSLTKTWDFHLTNQPTRPRVNKHVYHQFMRRDRRARILLQWTSNAQGRCRPPRSSRSFVASISAMGRHFNYNCHYGITQCYLLPETSEPRINPIQADRYSKGTVGWVDLVIREI